MDDEKFVKQAYRIILGRDVDDEGRKHYVNRLLQGEARKVVLYDIASSKEARQRGYEMPQALLDIKVKSIQPSMKNKFLKLAHRVDKLSNQVLPENIKQKLQHIKQKLLLENLDNLAHSDLLHEADTQGQMTITENKNLNPNINSKYVDNIVRHNDQPNQIWFDLTTSFEWREGIVGIVRAELQMAKELKKIDNTIKFFMYFEQGFLEILSDELAWLFTAESVADEYLKFFKRKSYANADIVASQITLFPPRNEHFYYPFKSGDLIFSMGWMDSNKEIYFSKLKQANSHIYLSYLVYDTILINENTKHLYHHSASEKFFNYVEWISKNCDYIVFGGETAKQDLANIQKQQGWPIVQGKAIKFGSDLFNFLDDPECEKSLKELGVTRDFILTVGSIEPRKNHDTLYRAYLRALEMSKDKLEVPMLVICGSSSFQTDDLLDNIRRNPKLKGHVIRVSPDDKQLAALYQKCLFTVLPSVYEGWSLTLPESLGYGKFCLCSDVAPLVEIGEGLVGFIPSYDVEKWAEQIIYYSRNKNILLQKEQIIKARWHNILWSDTARQLVNEIEKAILPKIKLREAEKYSSNTNDMNLHSNEPTIWFDLTTSFLNWGGGITGIIRAELSYARYLYQLNKDIHFFAIHYDERTQKSYFFEVTHDCLEWLFNELDLSSAYRNFRAFWDDLELNKGIFRNPFLGNETFETNPKFIGAFNNAIIISVGVDILFGDGVRSILVKLGEFRAQGNLSHSVVVQLIYDFTPTLYAHLHVETACWNFEHFLKATHDNANMIIYGGQTAMRDGRDYEAEFNLKPKPSTYIEFGSDIDSTMVGDENTSHKILTNLNLVKEKYILTVGTIEPRKNHEMLYKAYQIKYLEGKLDEMPTLVIAGKQGWKVADFVETIKNDNRFINKIMLITPSDLELDVLYKNCAFTVLPTFYEGWSLTLPESLSHHKFCLAAEVDPLKEIGKSMIAYMNPLHTQEWSDKILFYFNNPKLVSEFEDKIKTSWHPKTWFESAQDLKNMLFAFYKEVEE